MISPVAPRHPVPISPLAFIGQGVFRTKPRFADDAGLIRALGRLMAERAASEDCCTEADLAAAGFTKAELAAHGETARALAASLLADRRVASARGR